MITDEETAAALDRIARTSDGELLYRHLQKHLMGTIADHAPDDSALRTEHGMRRFAASLMAKMARGIDESGGSSTSSGTDGKRSERTVVFAPSKPGVSGRHVSARDYLAKHDPEFQRLTVNPGAGDT